MWTLGLGLGCAEADAGARKGYGSHWAHARDPLGGGPSRSDGPQTEWRLHKTSDSRHPDGDEQALVWLMNRARRSPEAEGQWLSSCTQPEVAAGRSYFGVDVQLLRREFSRYEPKPPAAFDARLYSAARGHAQALIARDSQDHHQQLARVAGAGFDYSKAHGSVMSYADSPVNAHAAFNIDWADGSPDGMDPGRKHRVPIMDEDGEYGHVGIAVLVETNPATEVGPMVVAADYAQARADGVDHFNRFLVGTVWTDRNHNRRYDPGEGHAGIKVQPDHGHWYAVTAAGGGYAIPVTQQGRYQVRFSGVGVGALRQQTVIGNESVELDCLLDERVATTTELPLRLVRSHGPRRPSFTDSALSVARASAPMTLYPQAIDPVLALPAAELPLVHTSGIRDAPGRDF